MVGKNSFIFAEVGRIWVKQYIESLCVTVLYWIKNSKIGAVISACIYLHIVPFGGILKHDYVKGV